MVPAAVPKPLSSERLARYLEVLREGEVLRPAQVVRLLRRRHRDILAFRRLVEHFLPLAAEEALRSGGDPLTRIGTANRALMWILRSRRLSPWDDAAFRIRQHLRRSLRRASRPLTVPPPA